MKTEFLTNPIEPNEIEWRPSRQSDGFLYIVPYITSRCVMERLDGAFGWDKWHTSFRETTTGYICQIKIEHDSGFVVKEDGASKTKIEADKGGISDALKRCAVHLGIGRNLYDYPTVRIVTGDKYPPAWAKIRLNEMVKAINSGEFSRNIVTLKND